MKRHLLLELTADELEEVLLPIGRPRIELDVADVDTVHLTTDAHPTVDDRPIDFDRLSFDPPGEEYVVTKYDDVNIEGLVDGVEYLVDRFSVQAEAHGEDRGDPFRRIASDLRVMLDDHVPNRETDDDVSKPPEHRYHDVDDRFANIRVTVDGEEYADSVREKELAKGLPDDVDVYVDRVRALDLEQPDSGGDA